MLITTAAFTGTARMHDHWPVCTNTSPDHWLWYPFQDSDMSWMVPAAKVILVTRSSSLSTTVSYTGHLTSCAWIFFLWEHIKQLQYEIVVETEEDLVARITIASGTIADMPEIFEWTRQSMVDDVLRVYMPMVSHSTSSVNATAVISMLNYFLCKSSLASEISIRDHMYQNETYLFWCSLPPVLMWMNSFGTPCIYICLSYAFPGFPYYIRLCIIRKTLKGRKQTNKYVRGTERHLPKTDESGWLLLRHIEMKRNENEYFGQITVAFLSSFHLYMS